MLVIVDYGMGNLRSVQKAIEYVGGEALISSSPVKLQSASALILPGVGAFKTAMRNLHTSKLIDPILRHIDLGKPFLGICLGFELLFERSSEGGAGKGLGVLKGSVRRFPFKGTSAMPVPHMGWNKLAVTRPKGIFDAYADNSYFYFVHSYYVSSNDCSADFVYATYGIRFQAGVQKGSLAGCQFHPEKSGSSGLRLLKNFIKK